MSASQSEWPFLPYGKITSEPAQWGLSEAQLRALTRVPWVVTEKIHGANFVFVSDGTRVRHAKRKAYLAAGDAFFGYADVARRLDAAALRLAQTVRAEADDIELVFIHGELFGATDHVLGPVQTGIFYSPSLEFAAFDVRRLRTDGTHDFLDFDRLGPLCEDHGLRAVEPLFRGTYREATGYTARFSSTVAAWLGEDDPGGPNLAEGVVVRPARELTGLPRRPLLKLKIDEFAEDERYAGASLAGLVPPDARSSAQSLAWLLPRLPVFFTPPRLASAISKLGRVDRSDPEEREILIEELVGDVRDELRERAPRLLALLDAEADAALEVSLRAHALQLAGA